MFKMAKKGKKPCKKSGPASSSPTTRNEKFWAPTKGYKYVFCKVRKAKEKAHFMDTIEQLSSYVATSGWKQASALAKVMIDLTDPTLVALARTTRTYLRGLTR